MGDTETTMLTNLIMTSDISAAIVGAGFANIYNLGSPGMYAIRSVSVSIVARMLSQSQALVSPGVLVFHPQSREQTLSHVEPSGIYYLKNI